MNEYVMGIDIGSRTIKIVIMNPNTMQIKDFYITDTTATPKAQAEKAIEKILSKNNIEKDEIVYTVATGYSREQFPNSNKTVTEITCQACGINYFFPNAKTIIDIGGQDSKIIKIENGIVCDFTMNDRCAAGTGRFLEIAEKIIEIERDKIWETVKDVKNPLPISSMCVVFAESEIISLIANGKNRAEIFAGVLLAIAKRTTALAGRINIEEPLIFTGGVANSKAMTASLEKSLGIKITIPQNPTITAAVGASIIATKNFNRKNK